MTSDLELFLPAVYPREHRWNYLFSAVRNHMGDQVSVDPAHAVDTPYNVVIARDLVFTVVAH